MRIFCIADQWHKQWCTKTFWKFTHFSMIPYVLDSITKTAWWRLYWLLLEKHFISSRRTNLISLDILPIDQLFTKVRTEGIVKSVHSWLLRHKSVTHRDVTNHWQLYHSFKNVFIIRTKKILTLHSTGILWRESTGDRWIPSRKGLQWGKRFHDDMYPGQTSGH